MKKIIISIIAAVIIIAGIYAVSTKDKSISQTETIKVGVILPLTGQYAALGESSRSAALLAKEELKADNIELIFEDDNYDAKKAVTAYKKLRSIDGIDAVLILSAPSIEAIKPLTDAENIPLLGLGGINVYEKDTVFQLMPSGNLLFPVLGQKYAEKYKKIAVAHSNATLFQTNTNTFRSGLASSTETTDHVIVAGSDMRTEVQKIIATKPDAVTVFMPKDDAIKFLKTLRVQDNKGAIKVVCDFQTILAPDEIGDAIGRDRLEGCIATNIGDTMKTTFIESFKAKYGANPMIAADYTYDAVQMVQSLLQSVPKNKWVETIAAPGYTFDGKASGVMKFNEDGTREDVLPRVEIYKNGKFEPVK